MVLRHFALQAHPFRITPDARSVYGHPAFTAALTALYAHVLGRGGVMLLLGETGTGKTLLLQRLRDLLEVAGGLVSLFPHALLSLDDLLDGCGRAAGLAAAEQSRAERIAALGAALAARADAGEMAALLLDEAQNLGVEMLRQIARLAAPGPDGCCLLPVVLAGGPALEPLLDGAGLLLPPPLRDRVPRVRLGPLDRQEVGRYIDHRLRIAGHAGESLFPPEAAARVAHHSRGVPRLINRLCSTALLVAAARSEALVSAAAVEQAAGDCGLAHERRNDGNAWAPDRAAPAAAPGPVPGPQPADPPRPVPADLQIGTRETWHAVRTMTGETWDETWGDETWGIGDGWGGGLDGSGSSLPVSLPIRPVASAGLPVACPAPVTVRQRRGRRPGRHAALIAVSLAIGIAAASAGYLTAREATGDSPGVQQPAPAEVPQQRAAGVAAAVPGHAPAAALTAIAAPTAIAVSASPRAAGLAPERLVARGDALLATGDLAAARLFYELAAGRGSATAARRIGMTFDPLFFAASGVRGMAADPARAAEWYRKAAAAGDPEAAARLHRLAVRFEQ